MSYTTAERLPLAASCAIQGGRCTVRCSSVPRDWPLAQPSLVAQSHNAIVSSNAELVAAHHPYKLALNLVALG